MAVITVSLDSSGIAHDVRGMVLSARFEPGDSVLAPVYYPGQPLRVVGPDGATVEITLDRSQLRQLARRALQNRTGRAVAGPCRATVTEGTTVSAPRVELDPGKVEQARDDVAAAAPASLGGETSLVMDIAYSAAAEVFGAEFLTLTYDQRLAVVRDLCSFKDAENLEGIEAARVLERRIRPATLESYARTLCAGLAVR
jgi:hypothetical protein